MRKEITMGDKEAETSAETAPKPQAVKKKDTKPERVTVYRARRRSDFIEEANPLKKDLDTWLAAGWSTDKPAATAG
jgi:hypothetical protein